MAIDKNNENKTLFEDLTTYANDYVPGNQNFSGKPKKLSVLDILKKDTDDSDHMAPPNLPNHMVNFVDQLGELYIQYYELQQQVSKAYNSSIAKDTKNIKKYLKKLYLVLEKQKDLTKECGKLLDKMSSI